MTQKTLATPDATAPQGRVRSMGSRFCRAPLRMTAFELGMSPVCQPHIAAEQLPAMAIERFGLCAHSKAMSLASNDGYLLQHVHELNDFAAGMKLLLAPSGVIDVEFAHLQRLMVENRFDTIYRESVSHFSSVDANPGKQGKFSTDRLAAGVASPPSRVRAMKLEC